MEHKQIIDSLNFIRPNTNWFLKGEELIWQDDKQDKPTKSEIEVGWVAYQAKVESDKTEAAAKKATAEAKLVALGLDLDDLRALGL